MTSALQRISRNFGMVVSGQFIATGLGFLALSLNTRALDPEDLGRLFLVQATCELTSKVIAFQNWQTFIKMGAEEQGKQQDTTPLWVFGVTLDFIAAALAAVVAALILGFAPHWVGLDPQSAQWGLLYAASLLVSGTGTCVGTLRLYDAFGKVVIINTAQAVMLLVSAAILFHLQAPLTTYLISIPLIAALASLTMIYMGWRQLRIHTNDPRRYWPDRDTRRRFFGFAIGVSAASTLTAFRQRGEVLIVGAILGPSAAALFGVAYRIAALFARFAQSARVSVYPEFSRMVAGGAFPEAARLAFRLTGWTSMVAMASMVAILFFGGDILELLFGAEFRSAAPNLALLGLGTSIFACTFAFGPLVQIAFGAGRFLILNLIAFAGFVLFAALGPFLFGLSGAGAGAVAYSTVLAVLLILQIVLHQKRNIGA